MKKITKLLILALAVLSLNTAVAQKGPKNKPGKSNVNGVKPAPKLTAEQKAVKNADILKTRLNLTEEQYAKVIVINTEYYNSKEALKLKLKSDTTANKEKMKFEMKTIQGNRKKQISILLTPEQKQLWSAWKKEHATKVKEGKEDKMKKDENDIDANEE
jgi:hypothetical protein